MRGINGRLGERRWRISRRRGQAGHHRPCACCRLKGGSKSTVTRLDPQRGHFNRLSSLPRGKSLPLVQTSVGKSSSAPYTHSRMRFMLSRGPHAQRTRMRQPAAKASPSVSMAMRTHKERKYSESIRNTNLASAFSHSRAVNLHAGPTSGASKTRPPRPGVGT